jgi:hypothetical protein
LILALWALLLLSTAVFAWVKYIQANITLSGQGNAALEAKAFSHSGVMVALHPQIDTLNPILNHQFSPDHTYSVRMTGEGGRLNLNWIFTPVNAPDPVKIEIFKRYLERRGLTLPQREHFTDSILDWLNPGTIGHLNGAEDSANYHPPHRGQFLSVDELSLVAGSRPLVAQPGWQDDFTIYTNPGFIDLQSASRLILECLPGVGSAVVSRFLEVRQGPDHLDGTRDDYVFKSAAEALSYLGITGSRADQLAGYVDVEDPKAPNSTVHIKSTGQSGNVYWDTEVVATKQNLQPIIHSWKEL